MTSTSDAPRSAVDIDHREPLEAPWDDLTTNRAGAAAREQALALKAQAPFMTLIYRLFGAKTEERAWRIGADGEELVGVELAKAIKKERHRRWHVLHAVPVGERGSDIDHVLIGPGGVFTINTKHHPGAKIWVNGSSFRVNGHRQPYVRNSQHEAARAARLLSDACGFTVPVSAMIVTVNAGDITVKMQPKGVVVTTRNRLVDWVRNRDRVFTDEQVAAIFAAARRSTTWRPAQG